LPLKLVYFNTSFDPGLSDPYILLERYNTITNWCEALTRTGKINVTVVQYFSKDEHFRHNNVEYHFVRTGSQFHPLQFRIPGNGKKLFQSLHPDIIHTGGIPSVLPALRSITPETTAIVWQHHGGGFPTLYTRWIYRQRFLHVDAFLFTSRLQADEWQRYKLIRADRIYELPESSTLMSPYPYTESRAFLQLPDVPVFLWVGHLNPNKDPLTILSGFKSVLRHNPSARLYMAFGSGDLLSLVTDFIRNNTMTDSVYLLGTLSQEALRHWYSAADYFVVGSHHEGSGYALIEAMACGAIPIVTDIPSFRVLTNNGRVGKLWKAGDSLSFAEAVSALILQPQFRGTIISYFNNSLSFDAIASAGISIYKNIHADRLARIQR
jgi:glycosyltransferase involved in cell wall biosynthesis